MGKVLEFPMPKKASALELFLAKAKAAAMRNPEMAQMAGGVAGGVAGIGAGLASDAADQHLTGDDEGMYRHPVSGALLGSELGLIGAVKSRGNLAKWLIGSGLGGAALGAAIKTRKPKEQ